MKRTTLILLLAGLCWEAVAQMNLDSLYAVWKDPGRPDTIRAAAYRAYIEKGYLYSDPDSAMVLSGELVDFATKRKLPRERDKASNQLAIAFLLQGMYAKAIDRFQQNLVIAQELGDREASAKALANIGAVYFRQGYYPKALEYFQRARALHAELGNEKNTALLLVNLANVYQVQEEHVKAQDILQQCLSTFTAMDDKPALATTLLNLGYAHKHLHEPKKALDCYERALALFEEVDNKPGVAQALTFIGNLHRDNGEYSSALDYLKRALSLRNEVGDRREIASTERQIAAVHARSGQYKKVVEYGQRALAGAMEVGAIVLQKEASECLYDSYKAMGKGNEALRYLELMRVLDDSLQAEETAKKLEQMEFTQQMFADSVAQAEKDRLLEEAHQGEIHKKNRTRNYLAAGGLVLLLVAGGLYSRSRYMRRSRDIISKERDRSENLLLNILPAEIAAELKEKGRADARDFEMVSILFTDFKGFTEASAKLSAQDLVAEINTCFEAFDGIIGKHGIEKIKTIGDAYMAAGGLPVPTSDSVMNTVLAGLEMQAFIESRNTERNAQGLPAFRMRVGVHTGPVVAGIVGVKKFQYDIWGDTVNTASRMESTSEVGQVNISEATYALVKNETGLSFTPRGKVQAKGKGEMEMYFVERAT